jgi:hypothetical protein
MRRDSVNIATEYALLNPASRPAVILERPLITSFSGFDVKIHAHGPFVDYFCLHEWLFTNISLT